MHLHLINTVQVEFDRIFRGDIRGGLISSDS